MVEIKTYGHAVRAAPLLSAAGEQRCGSESATGADVSSRCSKNKKRNGGHAARHPHSAVKNVCGARAVDVPYASTVGRGHVYRMIDIISRISSKIKFWLGSLQDCLLALADNNCGRRSQRSGRVYQSPLVTDGLTCPANNGWHIECFHSRLLNYHSSCPPSCARGPGRRSQLPLGLSLRQSLGGLGPRSEGGVNAFIHSPQQLVFVDDGWGCRSQLSGQVGHPLLIINNLECPENNGKLVGLFCGRSKKLTCCATTPRFRACVLGAREYLLSAAGGREIPVFVTLLSFRTRLFPDIGTLPTFDTRVILGLLPCLPFDTRYLHTVYLAYLRHTGNSRLFYSPYL